MPGLDYGPVLTFLGEAGIRLQWRDEPYKAIWEKYIFIASFGLVTALFGKTLGEVLEDQALRGLVRSIMTEIALLARKKGIELAENIVDTSLTKAGNFPFETKTSFQRDVETKGARNEADLFGGTIIRAGKTMGIETPVTQSVYLRLQRIAGWLRTV